eukprot:GSChrysophyteH2.ASY1.ANO1.222.1 assembled CDS
MSSDSDSDGSEGASSFNRVGHVAYFLSCLKRLPGAYSSLDATRLTVIYFSVIGLDMLGALDQVDKAQVCDFIYGMQLNLDDKGRNAFCHDCTRPVVQGAGGFVGGSYLGQPFRIYNDDDSNGNGNGGSDDVGHLAMGYTALATLVTLGDDLERLDKAALLHSIKHAQQEDGSFRATKVGTECDMRFVYCACAISHILRDWSAVNKDQVANFVKSCISYEGGFSLTPCTEAQGGATYCAVASLVLTDTLPSLGSTKINALKSWCERRALSTGGYNGRTNKVADSCYSFWVGATMNMLGAFDSTDPDPILSFLLDECQCRGGFSKTPGDYPDVLHSFYSLAWLAMNQGIMCGLKPFSPQIAVCQEKYTAYIERES